MGAAETKYRICPFCEATCGLELEVEGREVRTVRGDDKDVFSRGFICPKGPAITELDRDPDRLRTPLIKRDGAHVEASWDEAFAEIEQRLTAIIGEHGNGSVAAYLGNPSVHNWALSLYSQVLLRALRTPQIYSASSVDQVPKQLASGLMYGTYTTVAVPDIERCDLLLILGANPMESNGSLWTVPGFPDKLRALRKRGGRCIVVDPKRTRTSEAADEHIFIRPGSDAFLLMAIAHTLFDEHLVTVDGDHELVNGFAEVRSACQPFAPVRVEAVCGISAARIRSLAREFAAASRAAIYARIGTCTQRFGTLTSWLVDVCNALTGNLDTPGGVMFPKPPAFAANTLGTPGKGRGIRTGRRHSRVRGRPEVMGEIPVACLAEEIETPGDGQIRALITIAGNPVLSTPNGCRLDAALASLDFMVSLDIYLNETTRHADVILPGLSPLETSHYDTAFPIFAYRNAARYSPPVFDPPEDRPAEWQTLLRLAGIVGGQGDAADIGPLDDFVVSTQIQRSLASPASPIHGRDEAEIMAALEPRRGPERLLDFGLRAGPFGDGFGANPDGLTLSRLEEAPHGIDLGELEARLPEVLRTPSGRIELAPEAVMEDIPRLRAALDAESDNGLQLVGRRHLRSNNSWMHNLPHLARGRNRCTLEIHPDDAERLGLGEGTMAKISSRVGAVVAPVEITETIMPGVVSLPHGWGHDREGTRMSVARERPGANSNDLTDEEELDVPSGNAVLNGIPVTVSSAE
jgi:anaerobic selenocysteine-containing dehydrogenase